MHVTLAYVMSLDGKITKGDNPNMNEFSSDEDHTHFKQLVHASDVIIVGRNTYEAAKPKPEPGRLRIVFTSQPERYQAEAVPGQIEFIKTSPAEIIKRLAEEGRQKVLLASGPEISTEFLQNGLVDEIYITIEPLIFGAGKPTFISDQPLDTKLELIDEKLLNNHGTLLVHYRVVKN
ncbi:MAG TPA: dihydrofolate reductase family protein [Candidatus Saccharimonadales bacterium]|nr:dihydrofolate reductase family protein [Candidatus Saccharimonadales bacterium]